MLDKASNVVHDYNLNVFSDPAEVKIVKKETFNRWYSLMPYYMALSVSRLPLQVLLNLTFMAMTYWMSGLPEQLWRFCIFVAVGLMISLVAEGMGLAIGATFSITVNYIGITICISIDSYCFTERQRGGSHDYSTAHGSCYLWL